ncbi:hypothetical protein WNY78_09395 [Psychroserpens sp. AS72]|uniref:hypothetical protein n=1 Tax=Psychroserpens sp. AS72 TaxID=3135775 RepID=UPI0031701A2C
MNRLKSRYLLFLLVNVLLLHSCVSDVDFEQAENIVPTPTLESSLIFSSLEAPNFIDDTTQQERLVVTDTTRLEYINSDFFVDQLAKTNLTFQFTNSLNRDFSIDFVFVNDSNEQRYSAHVDVQAGQPNIPIQVTSNFLIEEPDLSIYEEATTLIYRITLPPTSNPIEASNLGVLKLESKATFYFEL